MVFVSTVRDTAVVVASVAEEIEGVGLLIFVIAVYIVDMDVVEFINEVTLLLIVVYILPKGACTLSREFGALATVVELILFDELKDVVLVLGIIMLDSEGKVWYGEMVDVHGNVKDLLVGDTGCLDPGWNEDKDPRHDVKELDLIEARVNGGIAWDPPVDTKK